MVRLNRNITGTKFKLKVKSKKLEGVLIMPFLFIAKFTFDYD